MQWTDRIRQVKIILVIAAVLIAVASLAVSHFLVRDLSDEERTKMEIWAQALNALNNADENTDVSLVLNVIQGNNTIPVIVMDPGGRVTDYRNIDIKAGNEADSIAYVAELGRRMYNSGRYIRVDFGTDDAQAPLFVSLRAVGHSVDICRRGYLRTSFFKACRAEQGVGGPFQGDGTPARHSHFEPHGVGRDTARELSRR